MVLLFSIIATAALWPDPCLSGTELEVSKSKRVLTVIRDGRRVVSFPIAVGRGGTGDKKQRGDRKTPVGVYRIVDFNPRSRFHFFMQLNYPNVKDAFNGFKSDLIDREQFDNIIAALKNGKKPPQNTALGGLIGLHGVGAETSQKLRVHRSLDWTEGCIALTNDEVTDLRNFVKLGTKVVIKE